MSFHDKEQHSDEQSIANRDSNPENEKIDLSKKEHLTEEEFIQLVLDEQEKALREERERRLKKEPPKKRKSPFAKLIIWVMSSVLLLNTFAFIFDLYNLPALDFIQTSAKLYGNEQVRNYKEAVVEVRTESGKGTGFAITEDGYILTNAHVIDHEVKITVSFPEAGIFEAKVIESHPSIDMALLKIDETDLPALKLSKTVDIKEKERLLFIGNPLGYSAIANEGIAIEEITLEDWQEPVWMVDAPIYKGNSGSPVLNEDGEVVGIIFATLSHSEHGKVGLFVSLTKFYEYFSTLK